MHLATRHRVLGMLVLLAVVTYVDRVCISVAGTTMQKDLGLTSEQWGWVLGAMNMAGQAAAFLSSVAFGYIVRYAGNDWNAPLLPMTATALLAALCWLKIDASRPLAESRMETPS